MNFPTINEGHEVPLKKLGYQTYEWTSPNGDRWSVWLARDEEGNKVGWIADNTDDRYTVLDPVRCLWMVREDLLAIAKAEANS